MLVYNLDIDDGSQWLRTTPGELALKQPYWCTEAGRFIARRDFNTSRSFKDSYILFYTLAGSGYITQNGQEVWLKKGMGMLMNCRTPQAYRTDGELWDHYWIHINGAGVDAAAEILIPGGRLTPLRIPDTSAVRQFDSILKNIAQPNTGSILRDSLAVHRLIHMLNESLLASGTSLSDSRNQLIDLAVSYMNMHYQEDIGIDDLLDLTHLSRSYFLELFRSRMGTSVHSYLTACRITRAKELLETTDMSVAEIALLTGFRDTSAFSVRFSKITGESPLRYRKNSLTWNRQTSGNGVFR